jgi:CheY-like chemotaxis protein
LIVDDQDVSAVLSRAILASEKGIAVVARAHHGREALTLAASVNPDVILMDLHMPVMDGIEATRRLREAGSKARIIIVTGSDVPGELAAAREAGADSYVPKPQIAEALIAAIFGTDIAPG